MGRLIKENTVIEVAEKFTFTDENERRKYLDFVRYCVQNSKTAYDVEKVVDVVREDCYSMGFDESQTDIVVKDIRKGGVE